jgi:hypothetical protein
VDAARGHVAHEGLQALGAAAAVAAIITGGMLLANLPTADFVVPSIEDRRGFRPAPTSVPQIDIDFPLTAGWVAAGIARGPDRLYAPLVLEACHSVRTVPSGDDRVRAGARGPGVERNRELHIYPDPEAARAAYAKLDEHFQDCAGDDNARIVALATHTGFQVLKYDAEATEVVSVVQRGRAVIVAVDSRAEGSLPTAEEAAREQWSQLTAPIERLCEFTAEGCARLYG